MFDIWVVISIFVVIGLFVILFIAGGNNKIQNKKLLKTVTMPDRGTWSERELVLELLKYGISEQAIFHDLYLKKHNGCFSQIDLVVATKVGIIVFV